MPRLSPVPRLSPRNAILTQTLFIEGETRKAERLNLFDNQSQFDVYQPGSLTVSNVDFKTWHSRHNFILSLHFSCDSPWHMVPLINQQRSPLWNSHAGQCSRVSIGHFSICQQGFLWFFDAFCIKRNNIWRSMGTETFLQPCSKLWTALSDVPNNDAIWLCVFPNRLRIMENSFLSMWISSLRRIIPQKWSTSSSSSYWFF